MALRRTAIGLALTIGAALIALPAQALADPFLGPTYNHAFDDVGKVRSEQAYGNAMFTWFADVVGSESILYGFEEFGWSSDYDVKATVDGTNGSPTDLAGELDTDVGGIVYDGNTGYLYVSDSANNRVVGYLRGDPLYIDYTDEVQIPGNPSGTTPANGNAGASTAGGKFDHPLGIDLGFEAYYLYVADRNNARVSRFERNGLAYVDSLHAPDWNGATGKRPVDVSVNNWNGEAYVALDSEPRIDVFDGAGNYIDGIDTGGAEIRSVGFDTWGRILYASTSSGVVQVYSGDTHRRLGVLPASLFGSLAIFGVDVNGAWRSFYASHGGPSNQAQGYYLGGRPICPPGPPLTVNAGESVTFSPTCPAEAASTFEYVIESPSTLGSAQALTGPDRITYTAPANAPTGTDTVTYSAADVNGRSVENNHQTINVIGRPAAPAAINPPTYDDDTNLSRSSGTVLVKVPGTTTFVPVTEGVAVPLGTVVDATNGVAFITWAKPSGATYSGKFWGGVFQIEQTTGKDPLGVVKLRNDLVGKTARAAVLTAAGQFQAYTARKRGKRKNRVWGDAKGKFRTDGSNSSASVRGTKWVVEDYANATWTSVKRGVVDVKNFKTRKITKVKAGESYYAWR